MIDDKLVQTHDIDGDTVFKRGGTEGHLVGQNDYRGSGVTVNCGDTHPLVDNILLATGLSSS